MQTDNKQANWKFSGTIIRNGRDFQSWQSLISNDAETMTVARACAPSEEDAKQRAIFIVEAVNNYSKLVEENERLKEILETCYLFVNDEVENNRGNKYAKALQDEIYKILK